MKDLYLLTSNLMSRCIGICVYAFILTRPVLVCLDQALSVDGVQFSKMEKFL